MATLPLSRRRLHVGELIWGDMSSFCCLLNSTVAFFITPTNDLLLFLLLLVWFYSHHNLFQTPTITSYRIDTILSYRHRQPPCQHTIILMPNGPGMGSSLLPKTITIRIYSTTGKKNPFSFVLTNLFGWKIPQRYSVTHLKSSAR